VEQTGGRGRKSGEGDLWIKEEEIGEESKKRERWEEEDREEKGNEKEKEEKREREGVWKIAF